MLLALIPAFLFGLYPLVLKLAFGRVDPFMIVAIMFGICAIISLTVCFMMRRDFGKMRAYDWNIIALASVIWMCGMASYVFLMSKAGDRVSIVNAIALSFAPVFAAALGLFFFKESLTAKQILGIVLAVIGAYIIVTGGKVPDKM